MPDESSRSYREYGPETIEATERLQLILLEVISKPYLPAQWSGISRLIERRFKELKRPNGCVASLFYGSSRLRRDCAFPIGLTLDAYLNLSKIRYVIPLCGALGPNL